MYFVTEFDTVEFLITLYQRRLYRREIDETAPLVGEKGESGFYVEKVGNLI